MDLPKEQLRNLEIFVRACTQNPDILHKPELHFFRSWMKSMGATIPPQSPDQSSTTQQQSQPASEPKPEPKPEPEPEPEPTEEEESDLELDTTGVIEPDEDSQQEFGDETLDITDEMVEQSDDRRVAAMEAYNNGNYEEAISLYTEAIKMNPISALLYAKRASTFLQLKKPNAAIQDCNQALLLNPDSAQPYKWRGKANRMLGKWEEAYQDLSTACKLDYDESTYTMLQEVTPNAKAIQEHRRKKQRRQEEKEQRDRQERIRKAREEYEKAKESQQQTGSGASPGFGFPGGFPGSFPGSGGGAAGIPDISKLLSDPDIMKAFQDPEVAAAFQDVSVNPANITKYQNNPKVQEVINKLAAKFGTTSAKPQA